MFRATNVRSDQGREDIAHPSRTKLCDMLYRGLRRTPAAPDLFLAVMGADIPNCLQDPDTHFKWLGGKVLQLRNLNEQNNYEIETFL